MLDDTFATTGMLGYEEGGLAPALGSQEALLFDVPVSGLNDVGRSVRVVVYVIRNSANASSPSAMALWRIRAGSVIDDTFRAGGASTVDGLFLSNGPRVRGSNLALDCSGRAVVAVEVTASSGFSDTAIWRVEAR